MNVASAGLASAAAHRAKPLKPKLGPLAYAVGAIRAAASEQPLRCAVRTDGTEVYAGGTWQAIVAVTGAFGGGAEIGAADPEDGVLDVTVLPAGSRLALARRAWGMRRGTIAEQRDVCHARGHVIEVDLPPGTEFNVDGELPGRRDAAHHRRAPRLRAGGRLMAFGNRDLAVDLGTANTLVYERGRGIVVSEPSVIAVDADRGEVYAVGDEAHRMIGRTPATISATRPLRHGVIADFEVTEQMLRYFLRKAQASRWSRPRVIMCVPSGVTEVETRAVEEACLSAGARQVALIEEPIAAAIGAGLEIAEPTGHMVVDIGGGTSEVAVISMGEIVVETSLRLAGYDLDEAIMAYVRRHANLAIGQPTAEEIKITAGSAFPMPETIEVEVRGRELLSGLPRTSCSTRTTSARRSPITSSRSSTRSARRSTRRRPSCPRTSSSTASCWRAAARSCTGSPSASRARPRCRRGSPTRRSTCVAVGAGEALEEFEAIARRQVPLAGRHPRSRPRLCAASAPASRPGWLRSPPRAGRCRACARAAGCPP